MLLGWYFSHDITEMIFFCFSAYLFKSSKSMQGKYIIIINCLIPSSSGFDIVITPSKKF